MALATKTAFAALRIAGTAGTAGHLAAEQECLP
jgi:hypothetical protein